MNQAYPAILVVDDEVDICRNLADIFTDLGYHIDIASDGPTALELLQQRHYDVALLDLMMPYMDGLALYGEIKKVRAETVALIVTAYPNHPRAEQALASGAWQIVSKPIEFPQLLGLVEEALRQPLVLVVDDDPDVCLNLWDLLRERGYRVSLAHDERTAVQHLRDAHFHVILLDMKLPDGDGTSLFQKARQNDPQVRVIVITGYPSEMEQRLQQVMSEGAQTVLPKPLDVPMLLAALAQFPGSKRGILQG